jgi:hypothetical protein
MRGMTREFIAILLVITVVLFAGCTGQDEPAVPEQVQLTITPVSTSSGTAAMTPVPHPVTTVQVAATEPPVRIFNGEYHWAEYRINDSSTFPPNPRKGWEYDAKIERSYEVRDGVPAVHEKIMVTDDEVAFHLTTDSFFESATKRFLGGTLEIRDKDLNPPMEIVPADITYHEGYHRSWLIISPFENFNTSLSFEGVESVTVPAGTFPNARKYSGKLFDDDAPITFWVSEGVPVPVQYQPLNPEIEGIDPVQMFELEGWE